MAFSSSILLDDASGDEVTYKLIKTDGTGTDRIDPATSLTEPGKMSIRHSVSGAGADAVDRHLVQFTRTVLSTGKPRTLTVNLTIACPRDSVITSTMIYDSVANLVDFIADGGFTGSGLAGTTNLASLLLGES